MLFQLGVLALCALVGCGTIAAKHPPDAGAGEDAPAAVCTAGATSCGSDNALYQCEPDGSQEAKVEDCQFGCSTDHCNQCQSNTTFCSGDDLVTCSASGSISNPMACPFGCQNNACNACKPDTSYCSGSTAVTCGADGQPGAMHDCGAAGCNGGVCNSCAPNTTSCQGDTLVVCNAAGTVASATACALGCSTSGTTHCKALVPSFGVPAPSGNLPALSITADSTLDISGCANLNVLLTIGTSTTAVPASQISSISQTGGPPICVVRYGAISIPDPYTLTVVNSSSAGHGLSLEGTSDLNLGGKIVFANAAPGPSPGQDVGTIGTNASSKLMASGGGGGGAARAGGAGGDCFCGTQGDYSGGAGGPAITTLATILTGGSAGGGVSDGTSFYGAGGSGGGALHLVSLTKVSIAASAVVNLNGGAGTGVGLGPGSWTAGGGGSGGTLVVEAPVVSISAGAIAVANGGGGAAGDDYTKASGGTLLHLHYNGQPGQLSTTRAAGGDIPNVSTGDGGYEANGATSPSANGQPSDSGAATYDGGGGGGSSGFIVLHARTVANVMIAFGAVISPTPSTGTVFAQ